MSVSMILDDVTDFADGDILLQHRTKSFIQQKPKMPEKIKQHECDHPTKWMKISFMKR